MTEYSTSFRTDRLINRFDREPFALAFAGQGYDWLKTLRASVAAGVGSAIDGLVARAATTLEPVTDELAGTRPFGFDPVTWARSEDAPSFDTAQAAVSVPGILTSQFATCESLKNQGLNLDEAVATIGHSQGVLDAFAVQG